MRRHCSRDLRLCAQIGFDLVCEFIAGESFWGRVTRPYEEKYNIADEDGFHIEYVEPSELTPDFTDAATIGCLTQIVREAWWRVAKESLEVWTPRPKH